MTWTWGDPRIGIPMAALLVLALPVLLYLGVLVVGTLAVVVSA